MKKSLSTLISLYLLHQGVRFAKIFVAVLMFGLASWRVLDGSYGLLERGEKKPDQDLADLFVVDDPLVHLRALLLFKSHCQINQGSDLIKISWLLSPFESSLNESLYLEKGVPIELQGIGIEFAGVFPGHDSSVRIFLTSDKKRVEIALPVENAPLVALSEQQLGLLGVRYLGINLLPPEEKVAQDGAITLEESFGVLENMREDCFHFISSKKLPLASLFYPLFPHCRVASANFMRDKALLEIFDEKGFSMKIELQKVADGVIAQDYFKQIQLERVTLGAALINFKQIKTPIKMGRPYLFTAKGCLDLSDKAIKERYMNGELVGQLVIYQGMTAIGTKKEAKFELVNASRTNEEERVLTYEAKRMDGHTRPMRSSQRTPERTTGGRGFSGSRSSNSRGRQSSLQSGEALQDQKFSLHGHSDEIRLRFKLAQILKDGIV